MQADAKERARRRFDEFKSKGIVISFEKVLEEVNTRDNADLSRKYGPLKIAPDAVVIDTTRFTIEEQIEKVYRLAMVRIKVLDNN